MKMQILDTLQKLITHEQSARAIGNEAEASAFAAKIQSLLFRHNLSMSDIRVTEEREESVDESLIDARDRWRAVLLGGVAKSMFCRTLKAGTVRHIVGTETNRTAAISLYNFLASTGHGLAQEAFRDRSLRNSYLLGFASAIYRRLENEAKALTSQASQTGNALVYVQKNESALTGFIESKYGRIQNARKSRPSRVNSSAYAAGQAQGNRVSLSARAALS
jgi:hypothetical protein